MAEAIAGAAAWVGKAIGGWLTSMGASSAVSGLGYAVGYGVTYVGLSAGLAYGISELTRPDSGSMGASQGRELQLQIDPTFPRQLCIGRRLVAGSMSAHYSMGGNREYLHLVVPLVDHPVQQCARVFGDGRLVYNTPLVHGVRTEIPWDDRIGGLVYLTFWDGRPGQIADPDLVTKSAQDPDVIAGRKPGWTTNHRGAGIAWVHIELRYDPNVMTSMPSFLFDLVGAGLYDRRLDSTAGGSGSHRLTDPSTWLDEWSDNAATALDHFLLGMKVENDDLAFGVGLRHADVPYAAFAAAADLSDEDVVTGEGAEAETIKRYRANGVISASDTFEDVIEALQIQMGARLVDYAGRIGIVPAEERTPVCSLSDGDWAADDSVTFEDRRMFDDLVGGVEGRFADPANVYQPTAYAAQRAPDATFADGGEASTRTLELPFEVHPRRAARLARIWLERERRQSRLSGTFTHAAWELEPGDWFSYSSTHEQLEDELFEVIDLVKNADFTVTLTAQAVDAGIVAFDNDNDPDLSEPVFLEPVDVKLAVPEFDVEATTLEAAGVVEPAILFTLTSDDSLVREVVIERAEWDNVEEEFVGASIYSQHHADQATTVLRSGILPSTYYKVRCKVRAGSKESDWAEWSAPVLTGSTYSVGSAGVAGSITGQGPGATATGPEILNSETAVPPGIALGAFGDIQLTANQIADGSANDGEIRVQGTTIYTPMLGKVTLSQTQVQTPFEGGGDMGRFFLIMGATNTSSRFSGWSGNNGPIFVARYNWATEAWSAVDNAFTSYPFTPLPTDSIIGVGDKTAATTGITWLTSLVTRNNALSEWITSQGTAAAFTGQGLLATLSAAAWASHISGRPANLAALGGSEGINNALVPVGANALRDTEFRFQSTLWDKASNGGGTTTFSIETSTGGLRKSVVTGAGVTANGTNYINQRSWPQRTSFPCSPGENIGARMLVAGENVSLLQLFIIFRNAAGTLIDFASATVSTGLLTGSGEATTFHALSCRKAAPAAVATAHIEARGVASSSAPVLRIAEPMLAKIAADQTAVPAYAPGREHETGANVTETRTASGISGQGSQATANHYRGASYPGTPTEGSWWVDTSTNYLKLYTGGAWQNITYLLPNAPPSLSISFSPNPAAVASLGAGDKTTPTVTVTITGGSGNYMTSWIYADPAVAGPLQVLEDGSFMTQFTRYVGVGQLIQTSATLVAYDVDTGISGAGTINLEFQETT